ncbi:MAG: hypothetical protein WBO18_15395 [Gammaproteobacteria bacterium]
MSSKNAPPSQQPPEPSPPGNTTPGNPDTRSGGFIHMFAQHPVAANLLMATMIILGAYSLTQRNKQFFPNFALD